MHVANGLPPTAYSLMVLRSKRVGPLILLENFPDRFPEFFFGFTFLDNVATSSNLVQGVVIRPSKGDILIDATWSQIQAFAGFPHGLNRRENCVELFPVRAG